MSSDVLCECENRVPAGDERADGSKVCPKCGKARALPQSNVDSLMRRLRAGNVNPAEDATSEAVLPGSSTWLKANRPRRDPAMRATPFLSSFRQYLYVALLAALIPLFVTALDSGSGQDDSLSARLARSLKAHPEVRDKLVELPAGATLSELIEIFPGRRLDGALLARDSWMHWAFAAASGAACCALLLLLFAGAIAEMKRIFFTALIVGTAGVAMLLGFQALVEKTQGVWITGGGLAMVLFYVVKFIGYSYRAALDPQSNLVLSFIGFTVGVGLCEELCKALPLIVHYRGPANYSWKLALLVGLACGMGFGISEGIGYSSDFYNGVSPARDYVLRFVSCVALHATWTGAAAVMIYRRRAVLENVDDKPKLIGTVLAALAIPMILHGIYDTLLKKDDAVGAMMAAIASFAFLVIQVETIRRREGDVAVGVAAGEK